MLTANRRLSRDLLYRYSEKRRAAGDCVWQTPLVLPFEAFLLRLHGELLAAGEIEFSVIDRGQSEQMWLQALQSVTQTSGQMFLSPIKTAASLAQAWTIMQAYRVPALETVVEQQAVQGDLFGEFGHFDESADAAEEPDQAVAVPSSAQQDAEFAYGGRDIKLFLDVADHFSKQMVAANLADSASLAEKLRAELERLLQSSSASDLQKRFSALVAPVQVVGFLRLTPQQQQFLATLHRCQPVSEIDPCVSLNAKFSDAACTEAKPVRAGFSDTDQELQACARWCLDLLNRSANQASQDGDNKLSKLRVGIVLPDLIERRDIIARTFDNIFFPARTPEQILASGRPYDIGLGSPLAEWPLVQPALSLIDLVVGELDAPRFSHMLLSPYLGAVDKELDFRLGFDRALRVAGFHQISLQDLLLLKKRQALVVKSDEENKKRAPDQLPLGFSDLLGRLENISLDTAPLAEWCSRFDEILKAARWPGKALGSHEHQTVQAWKELVLGLARLGNVAESFSAYEAAALLKRTAMQRLFQPKTDELPVQLLAPQDSVGLEFTHLWVCGMDANHWPGAASPNPWLPRPWQKSVGVPGSSALQCTEDAAKLLAAWLASGSKVLFSYSVERDEQEVQVASAIEAFPELTELLESDESDEQAACSDWQGAMLPATDSRELIRAASQLQGVADRIGPAVADGQKVKGGARFFQDQAQCPFRAFVNHRLRIRPLEEGAPGLDARLKGNVLHRALQLLWQQLRTREKLQSLSGADQRAAVRSVVDQAIVEEIGDEMLQQQKELERARLCELIDFWLQEREFPRSNFEVIDTEREVELEIESMKFSLTVDRIDQLDSGEQVLIDYKTGSGNKPSDWMQERPQNPQLPLYSLVQEQVDGLGFAEINRNKAQFKGIASRADLLPGLNTPKPGDIESAVEVAESDQQDPWLMTRGLWRERIAALAHEIKSGLAIVNPQKNACNYCDLAGMCRIDPQRLEEVLAEDPYEQSEDETPSWSRS